MSTFSFAEGAAMFDSTPIENLFLLEYLPVAPEAFLRVYLYARVLALHPELGGDIQEMANALRMDEDVIYDAFAYWEQQGLARRLTDRPPTYELIAPRAESMIASNPMEHDYYAYRDFNASLQTLFGDKLIEGHEYRVANDWLNALGYDQAAALRLVQYGIATSRVKNPSPVSVFKRMDKLAAAWSDRGCRTLEDVERAIADEEGVYSVAQAVLKAFALNRKPTMPELECVKRWTGEWGYTQAQIIEACGETSAARNPSFGYLDTILKNRLDADQTYWADAAEALRELDGPQAQPTPDVLKRYAALRRQGFEKQAVALAAVQCHRKKKRSFDDLEWMLNQWAELGLFTEDAARSYIEDMSEKRRQVRAFLERNGLESKTRMEDIDLFCGWQGKYDPALIDYAAECVKGSKGSGSFMQRVDELLSEWQAAGVNSVEDAKAHREENRGKGAPGAKAKNPALDYAQRDYKDEDFDNLFIDLDKYGEGGDKA